MAEINSLRIQIIEIRDSRNKFWAYTGDYELASPLGLDVIGIVGQKLHQQMDSCCSHPNCGCGFVRS